MLKVMTNAKHGGNEDKDPAASELKHLQHEGAELGGSLAAMAKRTAAHFSGRDNKGDDAIEIWGKRIGRTLSAIAFVGLALYLYVTYIK